MSLDKSQSADNDSSAPVVYLMYHEIEVPGRPLTDPSPGYTRYAVSRSSFTEQMRWLHLLGWRAMSVTQALDSPHDSGVALTFDDGCESDLTIAAPMLREFNFSATFYLTVRYLGKPGHLSHSQARQLGDSGFELGCHSLTHPYLTDLSPEKLDVEIAQAKNELEQLLGRRVDHFSCPGGRWSPQVARAAREAGFCSVATSRPIVNRPQSDRFSLGRVAIRRNITLPEFEAIAQGRGLWRYRTADSVRAAAARFLGNSAYDRLRSLLLSR